MNATELNSLHDSFGAFLTAQGKSEIVLTIEFDELGKFLRKVRRFSKKNHNNVVRVGVYPTLNSLNEVTTYLVGLDIHNHIPHTGGGVGEGTPLYKS